MLWGNSEGILRCPSTTLTSEEVLIVAPCNAQVSALIEAMWQMRDRIGTPWTAFRSSRQPWQSTR